MNPQIFSYMIKNQLYFKQQTFFNARKQTNCSFTYEHLSTHWISVNHVANQLTGYRRFSKLPWCYERENRYNYR